MAFFIVSISAHEDVQSSLIALLGRNMHFKDVNMYRDVANILKSLSCVSNCRPERQQTEKDLSGVLIGN